MLLWIPLREVPGIGTILNAVVIGVAADAFLLVLDQPDAMWLRGGLMVGGVVVCGLATAMYIGAQLGRGPRDGLMTGFARRTGLSLRLVRTLLEVTVVVIGLLLGGVVGFGTVLYALAIGPLTQLMLPAFIVEFSKPVQPVRRARASGASAIKRSSADSASTSAFRRDDGGGVGRDHHLDSGEAVVGEPVLAQGVDPAVGDRRPELARGEVVEHDDAAVLDQVGDRVDGDLGRLLGVEEQQ
jgi:hypothetical protein